MDEVQLRRFRVMYSVDLMLIVVCCGMVMKIFVIRFVAAEWGEGVGKNGAKMWFGGSG